MAHSKFTELLGGKHFSAKRVGEKYPELYEKWKNTPPFDIKTHFYAFIEGIEVPKCANARCRKPLKVKAHRFPMYCNSKCQKSDPDYGKKYREKILRKYGVPSTILLPEVNEKIKQTKIVRYGTEHVFASEEVKAKIKQTNLERYGETRASKSKEVKEKLSESLKKTSASALEKRKQTNMERYGFEWASQHKSKRVKNSLTVKRKIANGEWDPQSEGAREKRKQTMLERYGVETGYHLRKNDRISRANAKFSSLLEAAGLKFETEVPFGNFRADFVVGKTAIEINPTATHNTHFSPYGKPKSMGYHLEKTREIEKQGFRCLHVFDWDDFETVIESLKPRERVFARKCMVVEIEEKEAASFLESFHFQGSVRGQEKCFGLFDGEDLVQVMTFGKPRYSKKHDWELLRLCSRKDVIGGASKLFAAFLKSSTGSVVSYCDRSKFSGNVYNKLGFRKIRSERPNLTWAKPFRGVVPESYNDTLINKLGVDNIFGTNYGSGVRNFDCMIDLGFFPVYGAGNATYVFDR